MGELLSFSLATPEDIPSLTGLLDELFGMEVEFTPDHEAQRRGLMMILGDPHIGHIFVARHDGVIIGMANLLYSVSTALGERVGILEDVILLPAYRSQGVGRKLLEYLIQTAHQNGCRRITLLTDKENLGGQKFYTGLGFNPSSMIPMRLFLG